MIDLRRLQVLRAVHQHGTVTAAAAALHLTPSAVSHQIRELSRELEVPLLEPQGRGVRLTPAALVLVEHADELLARWEEARAALQAYRAGAAGILRLSGFPTAMALLAPAAVLLQERNPGLRVTVRECESEEGFKLLLADETDLLLLTPTDNGPAPDDPRFDQQPMMSEPLDLLVPADHPLTGKKRLALADAGCEPWILPVPGTCDHHDRAMVACAVAGFTPHVAHFATDWSAVAALVAHGLGISLIPRLAELPASFQLRRLPLTVEPLPTRQIMTCVRRGSRNSPQIQQALQALREVVEKRGTLAAAS
ncbi:MULTISPECIES: LysR family transcriptional regulator [Thermocrispum]|mgnify:CR=1 FL=1|jgi:DNA-binding transcriptional LysR family regulator|uniref:LysR substrate-binding domain-containing protein n=1 Tax=Thermocrispum agreste TaxID=37925 RepID=A0ABD6FER5_9PSEU|nr:MULTISPECIES: LysR family transcriptional regulator [Thermocrispum]